MFFSWCVPFVFYIFIFIFSHVFLMMKWHVSKNSLTTLPSTTCSKFPFCKQWYIAIGSGSCIRSGERDITVCIALNPRLIQHFKAIGIKIAHALHLLAFELCELPIRDGREGRLYLALRSLYNSHFPSQCTIACEMGICISERWARYNSVYCLKRFF